MTQKELSNILDDDIISKIDNKETIIANNANIKDIIKYAINKLGNNADLNFIDVSKITDMNTLFYKSNFNGDISKWDVSHMKCMTNMFANSKFNQDISKWDVSSVEYMHYMFANSNFNNDISLFIQFNILFIDGILLKRKPVA